MRMCSGCQTKVEDNVRFCADCSAERQKQRDSAQDDIKVHGNKYDAEIAKIERGTRWQGTRKRVINRDPLCKRCGNRPSIVADHIVPAQVAIQQARDSGKFPYDPFAGYYLMSNLQGLCNQCHGTKTLEDKLHVGPWPDVVAIEEAAPKKKWTF